MHACWLRHGRDTRPFKHRLLVGKQMGRGKRAGEPYESFLRGNLINLVGEIFVFFFSLPRSHNKTDASKKRSHTVIVIYFIRFNRARFASLATPLYKSEALEVSTYAHNERNSHSSLPGICASSLNIKKARIGKRARILLEYTRRVYSRLLTSSCIFRGDNALLCNN